MALCLKSYLICLSEDGEILYDSNNNIYHYSTMVWKQKTYEIKKVYKMSLLIVKQIIIAINYWQYNFVSFITLPVNALAA